MVASTRLAAGAALSRRLRSLSTRPEGLATALAWGDTSTWWDWAARCLTLSAAASGLPMGGCARFRELWRRQRFFVTRAHGVRFVRRHDEVHGAVAGVVVSPRLAAVSRRSFTWACDVRAEGAGGPLLATTRGTFVHVDAAQTRAAPLPDAVYAELASLVASSGDEPERFAAPAAAPHTVDWTATVRRSDADAFGHVNNAKYALLAADALLARRADPRAVAAIDVEYRRPATPGDVLTATVAEGRAAARVEVAANGAVAATVDFTFWGS